MTTPKLSRIRLPLSPKPTLTNSTIRSPTVRHHTTSTINTSEINHFNALASSWWDPHGPSRLLHLMNPPRHTFLRSCLASHPTQPSKNLHLLDVGCGGGIFAESAARLPHFSSITAIDPSPSVLTVAQAHLALDPPLHATNKLTYLQSSIEDLPRTKQYDVVSMFEVLEHVSNPSNFLREATQRVKPGGWIVGSTIARTWTSWVVTNVIAEEVLGVVPRGTHDWRKYVNEYELRAWFVKLTAGTDVGGMDGGRWDFRSQGVVYVPGFGWRVVEGGEKFGNYFFAARRME
ncbi:ubiquinone biosynthesis O-methyltransferase [Microthyrium microscopicum]|uniref:Ubiquinone biosynthesis O-methyltransferase, mitochondrial n=1 Tax=Microthyrium microscopicum TaxID=703497 RepID=A0A6A6USE0_9PEZI|nr:ubiquinone biosynthesis O-methyltransferase [Microthyrium microscopicum]